MTTLCKYERTEGNTIVDTSFIRITDDQKIFFDWLVEHGAIKGVTVEKIDIEDLT